MDRARVKEDLYTRLGWICYNIPWLDESRIEQVNEERSALREELSEFSSASTDGLKPRYGPLSPGCEACRDGRWSCLFLNSRCNADCFWCLRDRNEPSEPPPNAHGLEFRDPDGYAEFLVRCGYTAVGFSGGEPLLDRPRLLDYIRAVRDRLGDEGWLWLYTNGLLITREIAGELADAGLDEIRVDIAACGYDLEPLKWIARTPLVPTVEIPCLPEDKKRLERLLPVLQDLGVRHLHLHQLAANEKNIQRYLGRGYTFLHHPEMIVLESDFTALRLIRRAAELGLTMGVQLCTKPYKKRAQGRSRRLRALQFSVTMPPLATVTETGFLREFIVASPRDSVGDVNAWFRENEVDESEWRRIGDSERFRISCGVLSMTTPENLTFSVHYREPRFDASHWKQVSGGIQRDRDWTTRFLPVGEVHSLNRVELQWLRRKCTVSAKDETIDRRDPAPVPERMAPWETDVDGGTFF